MENKKRLSSESVKTVGFILSVIGLMVLLVGETDFIVPVLMGAFGTVLLTTYHDVYYDEEKLYIKKLFAKEFTEIEIKDIRSIKRPGKGRWGFPAGPAYIVLNDGSSFKFSVKIELSPLEDLLEYIKIKQ